MHQLGIKLGETYLNMPIVITYDECHEGQSNSKKPISAIPRYYQPALTQVRKKKKKWAMS
jgi:hypothetical protein